MVLAVIVFEDGHRSTKLMAEIERTLAASGFAGTLQVQGLDMDSHDNCVISLKTDPEARDGAGAPHVILSRFSGSAHYRNNAELQDLSLLLCGMEDGGRTSVLNGIRVIQLEDSKPLQIAQLSSRGLGERLSPECARRVLLPETVFLRMLTPTALAKAADALEKQRRGAARQRLVLKPAYGGGSRGIQICHWDRLLALPNAERQAALQRLVRECKAGSSSSVHRPWLLQRFVGRDAVQVRVEVVDGRVLYAVVIRRRSAPAAASGLWYEPQNLCLCEVSDDVELALCADVEALAAELHPERDARGLASAMFEFAHRAAERLRVDIHAMEFRVEGDRAYVIDMNLQSNYNFAAERTAEAALPRFRGAGAAYVSMLLRHGLRAATAGDADRVEAIALRRAPGVAPTSAGEFAVRPTLHWGLKEVDLEAFLERAGRYTWTRGATEFDRGALRVMQEHAAPEGRARLTTWTDPVTGLHTAGALFELAE